MMIEKRPQILLVEDSSDDIELVKLSLASQLIQSDLIVTHDGEEALSYISHAKQLPDLVLLDIRLPKFSGLEVLKKLRQDACTKFLPVIIFTSSDDNWDVLKSYDLGANAFIRKSLDPAEFKAALKNLDIYWLVKSA